MGPLGRRMFLRTRLQMFWNDSESRSAFEAQTIRVLDAFTRGGAQRAGGQHNRGLNVGSDLDYVRGIHSFRTGLQFDTLRVRADDTTNYLGTYTFESQRAFEEGRPRSYTQRVGDPEIRYNNVQAAWYGQDDMRIRRNLTVSAGVRYEAQTHVDRLRQLHAARRRHLGAVQERRHHAANELGHLPRLAARRHLRADAARGRLQPARGGPAQPVVSRRGRRRDRAAGEPLPPRRRPAPAAHQPRERRRRSAARPAGPDQRRPTPTSAASSMYPRAESECAGGRRAARPRLRQHRRGGVRRARRVSTKCSSR